MDSKESLLWEIDHEAESTILTEPLHEMFMEYCKSEMDWGPEYRQRITLAYERIRSLIHASWEFAKDEDRNNFEEKIGL